MSDLGHACRLLGLTGLTLDEFDEARAAFLDNIRRQDAAGTTEQDELFEEGGRLAVVVHLRIESFHAFAREALRRLDGPPELVQLFDPDRDFHVRLDDGRTAMVASVLAASGDARTAPGSEGVDLRELQRQLEAVFATRR